MWDADRHDAAGARLELHAAAVEVEDGLAFEHVETRLERVDVRVDVPALQGDERQRHVRRAERSADEAARSRGSLERPGSPSASCDVLAPDEPVRRHPVGEVPRAGVGGHAPEPAPTSADAATAPATPSPPAAPFGQEVGAANVRLAGDEQLFGREACDHFAAGRP